MPDPTVAFLVALPALGAMIGMLINGWHADATGERRWHAAIPLFCASAAYLLMPVTAHHMTWSLLLLTAGMGFLYSSYPPLWSMPTLALRGSVAAASFGLINSLGQLGGLVGPYTIGSLNDRTAGLTAPSACYLVAAAMVACAWVRTSGLGEEKTRFAPASFGVRPRLRGLGGRRVGKAME